MTPPATIWVDLVLQQSRRCHHLGWFLYGCIAREQVLNLDSYLAWWARGGRARRA